MYQILITCRRNEARSQAARVMMVEEAIRRGITDLVVKSAGVLHSTSFAMDSSMERALKNLGYNTFSDDVPQEIGDGSMLSAFDEIYTMSLRQKSYLISITPTLEDRIYTLPERAGNGNYEIQDPGRKKKERNGIANRLFYDYFLMNFPVSARVCVYNLVGIPELDGLRTDVDAIDHISSQTARKIQSYVKLVLNNLLEEGQVHIGTLKEPMSHLTPYQLESLDGKSPPQERKAV